MFRSSSPPRQVYVSDIRAFLSGNEGALRTALSGPKCPQTVKEFRKFMKSHGLTEHTDKILTLVKTGIPSGKASQAYWGLPATVAKYGSYAISYAIHDRMRIEMRAKSQVKQRRQNQAAETPEDRRKRPDADNVKITKRNKKKKKVETFEGRRTRMDTQNEYMRELSRKKMFKSTVEDGMRQSKLS
jgi:hypothetical protein